MAILAPAITCVACPGQTRRHDNHPGTKLDLAVEVIRPGNVKATKLKITIE